MTAAPGSRHDPDILAATPAGGAPRSAYEAEKRKRISALRTSILAACRQTVGTGAWVLELGCGHGHYLTAYASRHPDRRCLGVDFSQDRIRRANRKQQRSRVANLCFIHAEAGEFLCALPPELQFREVFILFPDPWPKRRHRKNRLVSGDFLTRLAACCARGCDLYFRSDASEYVSETRALFHRHPQWRLSPDRVFPLEMPTVFQQRAPAFESVCAVLVS